MEKKKKRGEEQVEGLEQETRGTSERWEGGRDESAEERERDRECRERRE